MGTFLFDKIIFGPVISRRLGVSLGINLLPVDTKVCSFDCIYCECGWTPGKYDKKVVLPNRDEVKLRLEEKLKEMVENQQLPDVITFAGNGEPTMHPEFAGIIDDTLELRSRFAPSARIAVLSNATMLHKEEIMGALCKVDDNIQKLDSAFEDTIRLIDKPRVGFNLEKVVGQLQAFNGKVIIQTMFIRGTWNGVEFDNTTDREVDAWLSLVKKIAPSQVMIYTIARDTPADTLQKVSLSDLERIARKIRSEGIAVQVSE
jgi:wyosine [tRNA(Phe)-imidazoG37] synthetase (radical SAM superfamily)